MSHTIERRRSPRTASTASAPQRQDDRQFAGHADPASRQRALLVRGTAGIAPVALAGAGMQRVERTH